MPSHILNDTNNHSINIYLNSKNASISRSDSDKTFILNNPIYAVPNIKLLIGCTSFVVANSIYNIDDNNNKLIIDDITYTVENGNYDSESITTAINNLISQTLIFNEGDSTFTLSSTQSFSISSDSSILRVLGFFDDVPFSGLSLTGSHICDLAGVKTININIDNLSFDNLDSNGNFTSNICSVNNDVNYGSYIFYNSEHIYHAVHDKFIKFLKIRLLDQDDNEINLNGSFYQLVLTLHYRYIQEDKKVINLFEESIAEKLKEMDNQMKKVKQIKPKKKTKKKNKN